MLSFCCQILQEHAVLYLILLFTHTLLYYSLVHEKCIWVSMYTASFFRLRKQIK